MSDAFRKCQFCGCITNARYRRCCELGAQDDRTSMASSQTIESLQAENARLTSEVDRLREATLIEAADAALRAVPERAMVKAIGEAAHYAAASKAVLALLAKP